MKKTLIGLGAALLLLALVLFKGRRDDASLSADLFAFDTTEKEAVAVLKVIQQKDTSVMVKAGGQWVTARDSFPVDTAKIRKNLSYLLALQVKEVVSRSSDPKRLAEYGLDTAQAKHVAWNAGGKDIQVVIGKTSGTDYSSTYWKWEDKAEIYNTPGNFNWEIGARLADWKDRVLFKVESKDVRALEVDWRDSAGKATHFKFEAVNDTTFKMLEPAPSPAKTSTAKDMLGRLADFTIDDFPLPGDSNLAKAGLDNPAFHMRVGLKDGKSHELKGSNVLDGYVYIQHPRRRDIVKISPWRLDVFRKKPADFVDSAAVPTVKAAAKMPAIPAGAK